MLLLCILPFLKLLVDLTPARADAADLALLLPYFTYQPLIWIFPTAGAGKIIEREMTPFGSSLPSSRLLSFPFHYPWRTPAILSLTGGETTETQFDAENSQIHNEQGPTPLSDLGPVEG